MIEEVLLSPRRVEHRQQLCESAKRVRGKSTLLVPEIKHLHPIEVVYKTNCSTEETKYVYTHVHGT